MVQPFLGDDNRYHCVYKITNISNQKIYIGKHSTFNLEDGYMGSGVDITKAINDEGKDNFTKEILFFHDTEDDAYLTEESIVTPRFVSSKSTYNRTTGGRRGGCWHNV